MIVRQGPARAALLSTLASAVLTVAGIAAAGSASAATTPPYEPDSNAAGSIAFYDASGNTVTTGSVNADPFAVYAVGSTTLAGATSTKASLFGYLPKSGQATGAFSGEVMSGPTTFPVTAAGAPAVATTSNPTVNLVAGDVTLGQLAADFPNTATDAYQGLYQLRIKVAGASQYLATDIQISGSTWTQVYPAPAVAATTTTTLAVTPAGPSLSGTVETLTATVSPTAAAGTVQFLDGATPIGSPVTVASGTASTTTTLTKGTHSLTAAFTSSNTGAYTSSTSSATSYVVADAPGAPTGVTAAAGDTTADVSWTAPADNGGSAVTSYTVTATPTSGSPVTKPGVTGTSTTVTGLTNGTTYTVTVTATNAVGTGPASAGASVAPVAAPKAPGAPTGVTATAGDTTADVSWTAPASDGGSAITSYTVTAVPSAGTTVTKTGVTGTSTTVTGLVNGTAYSVTVKAVNGIGTGPASAAATATPSGKPAAPAAPTATAGNGQATVTFTAPSSNGSAIQGYTVTASPGGATATGTSSPITVTGLTNGTAYTFTVTATNANGTGPASAASGPVTPSAVQATTTTLNAQTASVVYGQKLTVSGTVSGLSGAGSVTLRAYVDHGAIIDTVYPTSNGAFSVQIQPQRSATYRLLFLGDGSHSASASTTRRTTVSSVVLLGATTVRGRVLTVTGRVAPATASQRIYLGEYIGTRFVVRGTAYTNAAGRYTVSGTFAAGTHSVQLQAVNVAQNLGGVSVRRTVRFA